jgi:hypothetical protein
VKGADQNLGGNILVGNLLTAQDIPEAFLLSRFVRTLRHWLVRFQGCGLKLRNLSINWAFPLRHHQ